MEEDYYDDYQDQVDEQQEEFADVPTQRKKESLYELFRSVLRLPDSSKVGNLSLAELGTLNINVREAQRIANLAETFHHPKFAEFFRKQAEITLQTSASKKGWFVELFVSQKKFTSKASSSSFASIPQSKKSKWKLYQNKEAQPQT